MVLKFNGWDWDALFGRGALRALNAGAPRVSLPILLRSAARAEFRNLRSANRVFHLGGKQAKWGV
jgi:hypothetical protein